ncbi:MAG: hypothetical protein GXY38_06005 [Planctomycetes bacterium]|jgi:predicted RNase H-like HicB family nuclease|nr:hypothetical protein [Planctomycetota bacterium]
MMILHVKIWRDDRSFWHAVCEDLPGCQVVAMTEDEARDKMRIAVEGYMASMHSVRPVAFDTELVNTG